VTKQASRQDISSHSVLAMTIGLRGELRAEHVQTFNHGCGCEEFRGGRQ
jgi:hypothetical protein